MSNSRCLSLLILASSTFGGLAGIGAGLFGSPGGSWALTYFWNAGVLFGWLLYFAIPRKSA